MGPQSSKKERPSNKDQHGHDPEIGGQFIVFPEPYFINKTFPVPFNNIKSWVYFKEGMVFFRNHFDRPEDWREPKTELKDHTHDLANILEKYDNRRGYPGKSQQ
jgi:hypothetical protein